ncbi:MAG: T9SS type A sorting domain-containing protein [Flavobacteriaceae bacterium]|nr:T9SS type A sorting domain-containing protein [Flavobacteriaceae bacterium]
MKKIQLPQYKAKLFYTFLICTFFFSFSYSQAITTELINVTYINNPQNAPNISNCGEIDLITTPDTEISFKVKLTKSTNDDYYTQGDIEIFIKSHYNDPGTGSRILIEPVLITDWEVNDNKKTATITIGNLKLPSFFFNYSNGILFARYQSVDDNPSTYYKSCNYDVVKNPRFTLNYPTLTIPCSSSNPVTFEVTNVHNHPGNLSYQWSVGSGWLYNGNTAPSSITTSTNTITLTPNGNPLGNVSVVPKLNGTSYPTLTSTVSLAPYNPTNTIVGGATACSSGQTYSISNLPSNVNVTSWSISNASIASISNTSGNQTSLTVVGYGLVTLTAVLTNSCGQVSPPITKEIYIGRPQPATKIFGPKTVNYGVLANYSTPTIAGATTYEWRLPYPYTTVFNINYWSNNWQLLLATSTSNAITSFTGYGGNSGYVQVWGKNTCGNGGAKYISVNFSNTGGGQQPKTTPKKNNIDFGINNGVFSIFPNPVKEEIHLHVLNQKNTNHYKIQIFDLKSVLVKEVSLNNAIEIIDVKELPNGMYVLKYISEEKVKSQKIIIAH